jgi:hypothetical protein
MFVNIALRPLISSSERFSAMTYGISKVYIVMNRRPKTIQYSHIDSYHSELGKYILKFLLPLRNKKHLALFSTLETIAGW